MKMMDSPINTTDTINIDMTIANGKFLLGFFDSCAILHAVSKPMQPKNAYGNAFMTPTIPFLGKKGFKLDESK